MWRGCPVTGRMGHRFDKQTHRCVCGRWERGFAPKKEFAKARGECQICERTQAMDKDGTLGHHGYKRPGWGFIQGDCMGEGHRPYPETDALVKYQVALENYIATCKARHAELPTIAELPYSYTTGFRRDRKEVHLTIKRGTPEQRLQDDGWRYIPPFAELEQREATRLLNEISNATTERRRVLARIDAAAALVASSKGGA